MSVLDSIISSVDAGCNHESNGYYSKICVQHIQELFKAKID